MVDLLAGARGRSLCLSELCGLSESFARLMLSTEAELAGPFDYASVGALRPSREQVRTLVESIAAIDVEPLRGLVDPLVFVEGLSSATDSAMPWQPPFTRDGVASLAPIKDALGSVAAAIAAAPAAAWWRTGVAVEEQWQVAGEPAYYFEDLPPAGEALSTIHHGLLEQERRFPVQAGGPQHAVNGEWWSIPGVWNGPGATARPATTRRLPGLGAVELVAKEDSHGPERAALRRVRPATRREVRVYEVRQPSDWADLTSRFPMDLSRSRRGVWWQSTGIDGRWYVPDWQAVARVFDAVHVTVEGYLTTAGEALPVPGGHTVLGGWNPDVTYWLCDITTGPLEHWRRSADDPIRWSRE